MKISLPHPRPRALLTRLLAAGVEAANPAPAVRAHVTRRGNVLRVGGRRYDLRKYARVVVVGAGKASAPMAQAVEAMLGRFLHSGVIVVKYGHGARTRRLDVIEAGHPTPDRAGLRAAKRVLDVVGQLSSKDLLIVLISGGASSLLPLPQQGLTLSDKQRTTKALLRSGAAIQDINTVRKHLSAIKGGRLAEATNATVIALILSDVIGDDLETIGSGLTVPDPTTYAEACKVLQAYRLWSKVPPRVRSHLAAGAKGHRSETPKPGAFKSRRVQNLIIGSNRAALQAVLGRARQMGLHAKVLSRSLTGEATAAAKRFGVLARKLVRHGRPLKRPACVIAGGELVVDVRGRGLGGRAQEFALASALEIAGFDRVWIAGFGTDGTDGPTEAAGAAVGGDTIRRARRRGIDPGKMLDRNDSHGFFKKVGGHIITGPTGTNVNDLYVMLVL